MDWFAPLHQADDRCGVSALIWPDPPDGQKDRSARPQADHAANERTSTMQSSVLDIKLSEIMQFSEWLQLAMKAIEKGERVPEPPKLDAGEVSMWIQTIRNLEDQRRESDEVKIHLESEMRDRKAHVGRLTQQLQASMAEAKTAQATYKEMLAKIGELASEVVRYCGK